MSSVAPPLMFEVLEDVDQHQRPEWQADLVWEHMDDVHNDEFLLLFARSGR
jgi:hypothetical protein